VLRYVGYLLIVLAAFALAANAAIFLFGGLAERLEVGGAVRLAAFDDVAGAQAGAVRLAAMLEDADRGRPVPSAWLVFRLPDGWSRGAWTDTTGVGRAPRRGGLAIGRSPFTVSFPETHARLDVRAEGSVWVLAPAARVVWIDAAAIDGGPGAGRPSAARAVTGLAAAGGAAAGPASAGDAAGDAASVGPMRAAIDAAKALAIGRQAVYLVAAPAAEYAAVRLRLRQGEAPPGPAIWVKAGGEAQRLAALVQAVPNVDAAIVSSQPLADAAAKLKVKVFRVPRADAWPGGMPTPPMRGHARGAPTEHAQQTSLGMPPSPAYEAVGAAWPAAGLIEALGQVSGYRAGAGRPGEGK